LTVTTSRQKEAIITATMAFGFGGASNAMMGASAGGVGGVAQGKDLEVIQTEVITTSNSPL
jgi:hypothetical protein